MYHPNSRYKVGKQTLVLEVVKYVASIRLEAIKSVPPLRYEVYLSVTAQADAV